MGQEGLLTAGLPVHRVQGHTIEHPSGVVTSELGIGQRIEDPVVQVVTVRGHSLLVHAADFIGNLVEVDTADEVTCQFLGVHFRKEVTEILGNNGVDHVIGDTAVEYELAGFFVIQNFTQHNLHIEHFDVASLHLSHKVIVVLLCFFNPQDIIE